MSSKLDTSCPIHHLPSELLSVIFIHTLSLLPFPPTSPRQSTEYRRLPILLSSICQKWRTAAINTSVLWAAFPLSLVHPQLTALWLSRAGNRILDLDGSFAAPDSSRTGQYEANGSLIELLRVISPFLNQCRSLVVPTYIFVSYRHTKTQHQWNDYIEIHDPAFLHSFRTFSQPIHVLPTTPMLPWTRALLRRASNLRTLALWEPIQSQVLSNLTNLVELELSGLYSMGDLYRILCNSPVLVTVNVSILAHSVSTPFFPTPITNTPNDADTEQPPAPHVHTNLVHLECTPNPRILGGELSDLINLVTLPSLQSLVWHIPVLRESQPHLLSFLSRSYCALTTLELSCLPLDTADLLAILRHPAINDSLESYTFSRAPLTNELVEFLAVHTPTGLGLPRLKKLAFVDIDPRHATGGLVPRMIMSRSAFKTAKGRDVRNAGFGGATEIVAELTSFRYTAERTFMEPGSWFRSHYNEDVLALKSLFNNGEGDSDQEEDRNGPMLYFS